MELNISGLKCDYCDYRDDSVLFSEYKDRIGSLCPKCGNSLLTPEEYKECLKMYKWIDRLDKVSNILKWINPVYRLITGRKQKERIIKIEFPNRIV
jgi:hypothetical protein